MAMRMVGCVASGVLVASMLAGCGLQAASQFLPDVEPANDLLGGVDFDGETFTVTSKNFTEQLVLGKITGLLLKAAGAQVEDKTNAQGSDTSRRQVLTGDADMYWEYTGTAWISYLGQSEPISDPREQYEVVAELDRTQNELVWLAPADFNNTYAMAVTQQTAEQYDLTVLSDMESVPAAERTFCVESEFANRNDGLPGLLETYQLDVPNDNVKRMDTGVVYSQTAAGACTFGEVFDTDGRIQALDLVTLEDDRAFFPQYNPSLTIRGEVLAAHPELADIFNQVAASLDTETIRRLNAEVDVDGGEPVLIARDWLAAEGWIA